MCKYNIHYFMYMIISCAGREGTMQVKSTILHHIIPKPKYKFLKNLEIKIIRRLPCPFTTSLEVMTLQTSFAVS